MSKSVEMILSVNTDEKFDVLVEIIETINEIYDLVPEWYQLELEKLSKELSDKVSELVYIK